MIVKTGKEETKTRAGERRIGTERAEKEVTRHQGAADIGLAGV